MSGERSRAALLDELRRVGREHSDATVLFHSALATHLGLHPTDYKALGVVDRLGPMSAGELAGHTRLAAASVTNLIDRLVAKGLLCRDHDPRDRRRIILRANIDELTDNEFFASWRRSLSEIWKRYNDDELEVILSFLSGTTTRLRERTEAIGDATATARSQSRLADR